MRIAYDVWFEDEPLQHVINILEFVQEDENIHLDIRRRYGDDFGSRFGGELYYRDTTLEEAEIIKREVLGW